ncbi:MAG TPA: AraC family transcriptional regulator, partial [Enterococcus sp.]|nr:AraC family transcriptional regulator [Enterococcus sp.]
QRIADLFGYHPNYISKLLKDHTGSSYQELVVAQKIKKAKYLLSYTDETIQNIAEEVGYHNLSFFYKKFYTQTQMTPRDYRLASQQRLETMSPHSDQ